MRSWKIAKRRSSEPWRCLPGRYLNARPGLSLHNAYTTLIRWAHRRLRWTWTLKAAAKAADCCTTATLPPAAYPANRRWQVPPAGRLFQTAMAQCNARSDNGVLPLQYSENASWADIIRQSMRARKDNTQLRGGGPAGQHNHSRCSRCSALAYLSQRNRRKLIMPSIKLNALMAWVFANDRVGMRMVVTSSPIH